MNFGSSPRVIDVTFPALPLGSNRAQQLADNGAKYNSTHQTVQLLTFVLVDAFLADIIDRIPSSKYTLIYVTSPREFVENGESDSVVYNSDVFQEPLHMQLKRDYTGHARQDESDSSKSLFQKYQFLSPGTFLRLRFMFFTLLTTYQASSWVFSRALSAWLSSTLGSRL